jgi:hypothetical protein
MNWVGYFLTFLSLGAQVDAPLRASVLALRSTPLQDDDEDDEDAVPESESQENRSAPQDPVLVAGLRPLVVNASLVRRGWRSERTSIPPFAPLPLYLFMSLQC